MILKCIKDTQFICTQVMHCTMDWSNSDVYFIHSNAYVYLLHNYKL
jgi:hypothetical protein